MDCSHPDLSPGLFPPLSSIWRWAPRAVSSAQCISLLSFASGPPAGPPVLRDPYRPCSHGLHCHPLTFPHSLSVSSPFVRARHRTPGSSCIPGKGCITEIGPQTSLVLSKPRECPYSTHAPGNLLKCILSLLQNTARLRCVIISPLLLCCLPQWRHFNIVLTSIYIFYWSCLWYTKINILRWLKTSFKTEKSHWNHNDSLNICCFFCAESSGDCPLCICVIGRPH